MVSVECFYVNDEPESKFLYTETIKLYCIVLWRWRAVLTDAVPECFYVNDEPESKFLYTETIKLYCIVSVNVEMAYLYQLTWR